MESQFIEGPELVVHGGQTVRDIFASRAVLGTEFAYPQRNLVGLGKLPAFRLLYMAELLFVIPVAAGLDAVVVKRLILAGIGTGTKAGDDIIVGGVYQIIVKRSLQAGEIMAVGVAFYEDYVALVNFSDPVNRSVDDAVKDRIIGGKVFVHIKG